MSLKSFITRSVYAAASAPPKGRDAVAVFFYGAAPDVGRIAALAPGADVAVDNSEGKTRVTLKWPAVTTVISIDPAWDKAAQMAGMRGWVERFPQRVREMEGVKEFIASFDDVTTCYGTITTPGLDAEGRAVSLLKALLAESDGFFFSRNSFYGTDGLRITGFDEDPAWLGNLVPPSQESP